MRVLSLFTGIGGLDLGLERAGFEVVGMCEQDAFCRRVLAHQWPGVPVFEDVRGVTGASGVGGSTRCAAGSRARTSRRRARARGSTASGAGCGRRCAVLFERQSHVGLSLRTSVLFELEALTGCSMTWKQRATPAGRSWWVLGMSGRPTSGTACSSWPTALAREGGPSAKMNSDLQRETEKDWPTMRANEAGGGEYQRDRGVKGQERPTLLGRANHWPTPAARDVKGAYGPDAMVRSDGKARGELLPDRAWEWPTPRASSSSDRPDSGSPERQKQGPNPGIVDMASEWPTPTASQYGSNGNAPGEVGPRRPSAAGIAREWPATECPPRSGPRDPTTSPDGDACSRLISGLPRPRRLNVRFVEWLMGFPSGWVDAGAATR